METASLFRRIQDLHEVEAVRVLYETCKISLIFGLLHVKIPYDAHLKSYKLL